MPDSIRFGEDFEFDLAAYQRRRSGRALKLERIPMDILLFFLEQRGQLVTREQIANRVWGKGVCLDTDNSINGAIRKLRLVLKDDPEQALFIETVTGRGYRFIAPIIAPAEEKTGGSAHFETPLGENLIGKKVSHYRVLQLLGGGGMGVVYKAEDLKLGRPVALKFLPSELAGDSAAFERLQREAQAASALDHPNICSIYQLGEHQGQPFIVMQLLEGQTLREWIEGASHESAPSRVTQLLDLGVQIAEGLDAAHQKGIIHRDIKPANIFVTSRGQPKILDFGVAKFQHTAEPTGSVLSRNGSGPEKLSTGIADPSLTRTGISWGTPSYLSPEQIRREKLDGRTDLFSFGLVLHEMATGRQAFSGNTAAEVRDAVIKEPPTPIRQLDPELPVELEKIIGKAVDKDVTRRYQSAGELRHDLGNLREQTSRRSSPRNRKSISVAAGVVLLALVASLGAGRLWHRASEEGTVRTINPRRSVAILGFRNLSGNPRQDWISTAVAEMLSTELAFGQQLRVVPGENVGRMKLDLALPVADSYSPETLARIRNSVGADVVVVGSYMDSEENTKGRFRIDVQLQNAMTGETIAAVSEASSRLEVAELVSRAGAGLRQQLGVGAVSANQIPQVEASLPSDSQAVRFYSEGLARLRTFDVVGAHDLLEQAVAADPKHALSHSALAESWSALGYDLKAQEEAKKAFELSKNATREDQLLVEGRYRQLSHDLPATIEIYQTLWKFFPDDLEYGLRLAAAQTKAGLANNALQTVGRMRRLPELQNRDARIDLAEAKTAESTSDFARSRQLASNAAAKAQAQGNRLVVAEALHQAGYASGQLGDREAAIVAFEKARELWAVAGDRRGAAAARHSIAVVQYEKGDFQAAHRSFEDALSVFRQIGAQWDVASCSHNYATLLHDEGRLKQAKQSLEEALRIQTELKDERGVASDLDDIGNVLLSMGDLPGAVRTKEQALQAFHHIGNQMGEAITLSNLGEVLFAQGELALARERFDQSLQLKRQIGYRRGLGFSLAGVANILRAQDRLSDARASIMEAISLRKELADEFNSAQSQMQLADIALEQGNAAEAESLARGAAAVFDKQKVADSEALAQAVLSRALLVQGRVKEARQTAELSIALSQRGGDREARFQALIAMAAVRSTSGNSPEALRLLEAIHAEASRYGYVVHDLESRLCLGELELKGGRATTGLRHLEQLERDAQARGFVLIARKARVALSTNNLHSLTLLNPA
jgi:serine/threonine protein kinase/tetratricopeptide (TPR) repeat protein